jgi:hypothetical protein
MVENPKYDVAISFLQRDVGTAQALAAKLQEHLEVFFYPNRQEVLAGTDGMESMRVQFFEDCRLMVILYRDCWGKTNWTQIEETAIKNACFKGEWNRLFVISLDDSKMPGWISPTHIYYKLDEFGIEGAVGAIKTRVLDNKGALRPMTPVRRAEIQKNENSYRHARSRAISAAGEPEIREKITELMRELGRRCDDVNASGHLQIRHGQFEERIWEYVLTNGRVSMCVFWQSERTMTEIGYVAVAEFNQKLRVPGDPPIAVHLGEPKRGRFTRYKPDLSRANEVGWQDPSTKDFTSSKDLAAKCLIAFIELTNKGRT